MADVASGVPGQHHNAPPARPGEPSPFAPAPAAGEPKPSAPPLPAREPRPFVTALSAEAKPFAPALSAGETRPFVPAGRAGEANPFAPVPAEPRPFPAVAETNPIDRAGDALERAAAASGRVASQVVDRLRNNAELTADRGTTTIADEVVEKITGIAAREVPGVYDLGGDVARAFAAVRERIGLGGDPGEDSDRGISVKLDGARARVNVTLVIEYGYVVQAVSAQVRANVIVAVEKMLGLQITEVNIVVDDVHVPEGSPVA